MQSLVEIGTVVLEQKIFLNFAYAFFAIYLSPLGMGRGPSNLLPFTKGCFVLSLNEIDPVDLEKKIFEFRQCIFAITFISPLGKGQGPSFE